MCSLFLYKMQAESEDGHQLRQQLSGLTGHLRVCALSAEEVCSEVMPTRVLTRDEGVAVCQSVGRKEKPQGLSEFSNETQPRKLLQGKDKGQKHEMVLAKQCETWCPKKMKCNLTLLTKENIIELLPLTCKAKDSNDQETYKVACTTTITKIATSCNTGISLSSDPPITVTFSQHVMCGEEFEIPLAVDGRNVTLQPDTLYTVKIEMDGGHRGHYSEDRDSDSGSYSNDHLALDITPDRKGYCEIPFDRLHYRAIPQ